MVSANHNQKPQSYLWSEWKKLVWFLLLILLPGALVAALLRVTFGVPTAVWVEVLMAVVFVVLVFLVSYLLRQGLKQHQRKKLYAADLLMMAAFALWFYGSPAFIGRDGWGPLINGVIIGILSISYIMPRVGYSDRRGPQ